ncbi:hypothetical protein Hanom_Chr05g00468581 [Helianthus anomalus]
MGTYDIAPMLKTTYLSLFFGGSSNCFLLAADINTVVLKIPLLERCGINLNDCTLDKCLSSDQLIVRRIVNHIQNTGLACYSLTSP